MSDWIRVIFMAVCVFCCTSVIAASKRKPSVPVIIVDPGHGGEDPGAIGQKRIREKDIVLSISKRLADSLRRKLKAKVVLTRSRDKFITLDQRDVLANRNQCDLFLSIHANAAKSTKAEGIEIYYLNKATDLASRRLATRENEWSGKARGETEAIISDLTQTAATEESTDLSGSIKKSLVKGLKKKYTIKDIRVKTALFYVLVGAKCPSLLIETGFVTHPAESRRLRQAAFQKTMADAIADGVYHYLETSERPGADL